MELDFGLTKIIKAIVNSKGVQEILQIELTKEEQAKFDYSYEILNDLKNKVIL